MAKQVQTALKINVTKYVLVLFKVELYLIPQYFDLISINVNNIR